MVSDGLRDFLRPFTLGPDGYVAVTRARRSMEDERENSRWESHTDTFLRVEGNEVDWDGADRFFRDDSLEYYFTPAVLGNQRRKQVDFRYSRAIWIDFDEYVDWTAFEPRPSIVVKTSESKFHCYWLVDWVIDNANDIRYWCQKFLHHFECGDVSGFDATQLLKLPYGKNLKFGSLVEGAPFEPHVVQFEPDLQYSEEDFAGMAEPPSPVQDIINLDSLPNVPETPLRWQDYLEEHSSILPARVREKVATDAQGGEEGRSGVLYSLIGTLNTYLDSAEEVYRILHLSPNDKWATDFGEARGAARLWEDVNRSIQKMRNTGSKNGTGASESIQAQIKELMLSTDHPNEKITRVTQLVIDDLMSSGQFTQDSKMAIDEGVGALYYLDQSGMQVRMRAIKNDPKSTFAAYIRTRYDLNQGAHPKFITGILNAASDVATAVDSQSTFYDFAHYSEETGRVYINRYDGQMYVLDGERVTLRPNGHDDVIFRPQKTIPQFQPFDYTGYQPGGLKEHLLSGLDFDLTGVDVSTEDVHTLLKAWLASYFFQERMPTKPILMIHGLQDSGKTTFFQNVDLMLCGNDKSRVIQLPAKAEEFDRQVASRPYAFYDNVDVHKGETQRRLATFATGVASSIRTLYTTDGDTNQAVRAFLGLSTRALTNIQSDVAQRTILVMVNPFASRTQGRMSAGTLIKRIIDNRDALMSELLDFTNAILKLSNEQGWENGRGSSRMADFSRVLEFSCEVDQRDFEKQEHYRKNREGCMVEENDPVVIGLLSILREQGSTVRFKNVTSFYDAVNRGSRGKLKKGCASARTFNKLIKGMAEGEQLLNAGIEVHLTTSGNNTNFTVSRVGAWEE